MTTLAEELSSIKNRYFTFDDQDANFKVRAAYFCLTSESLANQFCDYCQRTPDLLKDVDVENTYLFQSKSKEDQEFADIFNRGSIPTISFIFFIQFKDARKARSIFRRPFGNVQESMKLLLNQHLFYCNPKAKNWPKKPTLYDLILKFCCHNEEGIVKDFPSNLDICTKKNLPWWFEEILKNSSSNRQIVSPLEITKTYFSGCRREETEVSEFNQRKRSRLNEETAFTDSLQSSVCLKQTQDDVFSEAEKAETRSRCQLVQVFGSLSSFKENSPELFTNTQIFPGAEDTLCSFLPPSSNMLQLGQPTLTKVPEEQLFQGKGREVSCDDESYVIERLSFLESENERLKQINEKHMKEKTQLFNQALYKEFEWRNQKFSMSIEITRLQAQLKSEILKRSELEMKSITKENLHMSLVHLPSSTTPVNFTNIFANSQVLSSEEAQPSPNPKSNEYNKSTESNETNLLSKEAERSLEDPEYKKGESHLHEAVIHKQNDFSALIDELKTILLQNSKKIAPAHIPLDNQCVQELTKILYWINQRQSNYSSLEGMEDVHIILQSELDQWTQKREKSLQDSLLIKNANKAASRYLDYLNGTFTDLLKSLFTDQDFSFENSLIDNQLIEYLAGNLSTWNQPKPMFPPCLAESNTKTCEIIIESSHNVLDMQDAHEHQRILLLELLEKKLKRQQEDYEQRQTEILREAETEQKELKESLGKKSFQKLKLHQRTAQLKMKTIKYKFVNKEKDLKELRFNFDKIDLALNEANSFNTLYLNCAQKDRGRLSVYCRLRPIGQEQDHYKSFQDQSLFLISERTSNSKLIRTVNLYSFDHIFTEDKNQSQVFEKLQMYLSVITKSQPHQNSKNLCLLAYGETGSGKTYTMSGHSDLFSFYDNYCSTQREADFNNDVKQLIQSTAGLIPRIGAYIYSTVPQDYDIYLTCIEVYENKECYLLQDPDFNLTLQKYFICSSSIIKAKDEKNRSWIKLPDFLTFIKIFTLLSAVRKTSDTKYNNKSSRSHLIYKIALVPKEDKFQAQIHTRISVVDLAGAERSDVGEVKSKVYKESQDINSSLTAVKSLFAATLTGGKSAQPISVDKTALNNVLQPFLKSKQTQVLFYLTLSLKKENLATSKQNLQMASKFSL